MTYSNEEIDTLFGAVDAEIKTIQMNQGFIRQEQLEIKGIGQKFIDAKAQILGTVRVRLGKMAVLQLITMGMILLSFIATMIAVGGLFSKVDKMTKDYDYLVQLKNIERGIK